MSREGGGPRGSDSAPRQAVAAPLGQAFVVGSAKAVAVVGRPYILVLAGINGAGKSSVGGQILKDEGLTWYNPDTYTRELQQTFDMSLQDANAAAWSKGRDDLLQAIREGKSYAFETTLGGKTIAALLREAARTHDVHIWYCGLQSLELHLERVRQRVSAGGHDIPEKQIRARYIASPANLIELMPHLAMLSVYDNSASVQEGEDVPDPTLVLRVVRCHVALPNWRDPASMAATPAWARPLVAKALDLQDESSS